MAAVVSAFFEVSFRTDHLVGDVNETHDRLGSPGQLANGILNPDDVGKNVAIFCASGQRWNILEGVRENYLYSEPFFPQAME